MDIQPAKIVAVLALFVVLIIVGGIFINSGSLGQKGSGTTTAATTVNPNGTTTVPSQELVNITVSGKINVTGSGMNATNISFYLTDPNRTFSATVKKGVYTVNLPNLQTYDVVVFWQGPYAWQKGFVPVKPTVWPFILGLLNQTNTTYNLNVSLPNYLINVSGWVRMLSPNVTPSGQILRVPTQVVFKAPNGMKFSGNITTINTSYTSGGHTYISYAYNYSVMLPNWQTYNVIVKWNGQYSTSGSCNESIFEEYAAVGTVAQTSNYRC